jgi:cyclopropane-fatty-acyl-phospholipid synthase
MRRACSNDFYRLWLDRNMVYSCAYFRTGAETIDEAQEQKLEHICRKLRLETGERLLDIGCGWGGLLRWAALHHGVKSLGVTLSEQQVEFAHRWLGSEGLLGRAAPRLADYRDIPIDASFDKVVSVGMYEHVGLQNLPNYFGTAAGALRPGGILLNHGIVATDPEGRAQGPVGGDFIDRYVFPGGELPHLARVLKEVARAGLEPVDVEDLRPHYVRTLQLWVQRLEARAEAAIAVAGPERCRIWRMYMAGITHAFERGWLSVVQVVAYKAWPTGPTTRPWTRDHQHASDSPSRALAASQERSSELDIGGRPAALARPGCFRTRRLASAPAWRVRIHLRSRVRFPAGAHPASAPGGPFRRHGLRRGRCDRAAAFLERADAAISRQSGDAAVGAADESPHRRFAPGSGSFPRSRARASAGPGGARRDALEHRAHPAAAAHRQSLRLQKRQADRGPVAVDPAASRRAEHPHCAHGFGDQSVCLPARFPAPRPGGDFPAARRPRSPLPGSGRGAN